MATVGDSMLAALAAKYSGTLTIGDGYSKWIAEYGPPWETLVNVVVTQSGKPLADGWSSYWNAGIGGAPPSTTFRIQLENNNFLMTEDSNYLRTE